MHHSIRPGIVAHCVEEESLLDEHPFSMASEGTCFGLLYCSIVKEQSLGSLALRLSLRMALLGCALVLFAASVWWDNAVNRGISRPSTPPIPYADVPQGGVNTYNLHAEVVYRPNGTIDPENNVKRTFEMIAAAGIHWVRVQFPWEDIEVGGKGNFVDTRPASKGASTWAKYDYIVSEARRNGLELLVRLDTPPDWARPRALASPEIIAARAAGRYPLTGPPDRYQDYADFAAAVAERYRAELRFFQLWNEPNLPGEWNYRRQDPAELVALLRMARQRIKQVHPEAVIVFPALAPTDGRSDGVNDLEYLQGVYNAGGRDVFDIMSAQLYGLGQPPSEHRYIRPGTSLLQPIDTKADVGRVVLLREIMERNGDSHKAVWVSELGWNSAPTSLGQAALRWGQPVSEERKGEYLVGAMQRAQREWPWMGAMYIWMFRFGGPAPNPDDPTPYFQLVDFDFTPLPAYAAIKHYLTEGTPLPPATRNPLPVFATVGTSVLVLGASAYLCTALAGLLGLLAARAWGRRSGLRFRRPRWAASNTRMLVLLGLSLAFLYWGSTVQERGQLPISAAGGLVFLGLALLRPDLALLLVPVTVPLYLAPKGIWDEEFGLRPTGVRFPLHEFVLWCVVVATVSQVASKRQPETISGQLRRGFGSRVSSLWPVLLFLVAGTVGVMVAAAPGAALREWRWLILEPLLFYALVRYWSHSADVRWRLVAAWLLTGVAVAGIGLLQLVGVDLTALLPPNSCFSDRVVLAEGGLQRISSVYCHPNNLGLALGRVWPLLAALALTRWSVANRPSRAQRLPISRGAMPVALGALICLAALGASFSKGAWLGALVALCVLGGLLRRRGYSIGTAVLAVTAVGAVTIVVAGLGLGIERLNPLGGSSEARVELWTSAIRMLRDYPLTGVGLDQFYHYRTAPEFGDRYIDPAARATTEQFAAHPHNLFLDLLVRMGPLGLAAMAWLVLDFLRACRRIGTVGPDEQALVLGLVASMAAALVHGLVDNFYFVPDLAFSFWLMLGFVAVLDQASDRVHEAALKVERRSGGPITGPYSSTSIQSID